MSAIAPSAKATRPRVVIVGAGFGGLFVAKTLRKTPADVTVIDRQNYHLFQPLLYQVATAALSPADIAAPIRSIIGVHKNTRIMLGEVDSVDVAGRAAMIDGKRRVPYDFLVLATGARHAYFGHDDWEPFAPGLKQIEDAIEVRRRILMAFEDAEYETDPAKLQRLMTLVIIGGGPTGVELGGAIAELTNRTLRQDFHNIDTSTARVMLIEAGPRILASMPASPSEDAKRRLEKLGVEVRLGAPVTAVDATGVTFGGERIEAATVIWAAGVAASPAGRWIGADCDNAGRIKVAPDLTVPGHPEIFAIGDTALVLNAAGKPLPGVAPVAKQQGYYVGKAIAGRVRGAEPSQPFHYRDYGNLATIGRKAAVIDFGWLRMRGFPAWVIWTFAHVYYLIGFRNRMVVALSWAWAYFTFQRSVRLITGPPR